MDLGPSHTLRAAPPTRRCHPELVEGSRLPGRIAARLPPTRGCGHRSASVGGARSFDFAQDDTWVGMPPRTNAVMGKIPRQARDDTCMGMPSRPALVGCARPLDCARYCGFGQSSGLLPGAARAMPNDVLRAATGRPTRSCGPASTSSRLPSRSPGGRKCRHCRTAWTSRWSG